MKHIVTKMLVVALFASAFIYVACNKKALNIPPPTQSEASFFTSESEFRTAIIGAYARLNDYYSSANPGSGGSAELQVWFMPGDDLSVNGGEVFEIFSGLNPSTGKLNQFFTSSYVMIARANKIIQKIEEKANIYTTPNLRNHNEGEMLFLRAFGHFMLWNVFGTAPVDTIVVTSTSQFGLPSSSGTQLLDQSIADLTRAAALLPDSWDDANTGRVTKNAAYALLGKCLVFKASANKSAADYQAAIAAFNQITGVSLLPNFGDNFEVTTENNAESLFEFQAGRNISGFQNSWLSNEECDCGVAGSYFQMFYDGASTYMGGGRYVPTNKLKAIFEADDPRLPYTMSDDQTQIIKYIVNGDAVDNNTSLNNHRVIRYADVLLLKAEAVLKSGGSTTEAIGLINQVRTRARNMIGGGTIPADLNTAETNETVIMQWIMDERLRELAAEGHRWFDIRRWSLAGYITLDNAYFSSVRSDMGFEPFNIYFPIPDGETSRNANIIQNDGY